MTPEGAKVGQRTAWGLWAAMIILGIAVAMGLIHLLIAMTWIMCP